ncbi:MAG: leucine-rich repeat domain-containing protein [Candidatus Hodarchaeota archaeon]
MKKNIEPWSKRIWYLEILILFVLSWTIVLFGAITLLFMLISAIVIGIIWIYLRNSESKLIKPLQNTSPQLTQQLANNTNDAKYDEAQYHSLRSILNVPTSRNTQQNLTTSYSPSEQVWDKARVKHVVFEGILYRLRMKSLKLRKKHIQNLSDIHNFDKLWYLKKLDLSHNQLTSMKGIKHLVNLKVLKLNNNQISKLEDIQNLTRLKKFFINNNQLKEFRAADLPSNLINLNISRNPIERFQIYTKAIYDIIHFGPKKWFPEQEIKRLKKQMQRLSKSYKSYDVNGGFLKYLLIFGAWAGITFGIALLINLIIWGAVQNFGGKTLNFWGLLFAKEWSVGLFFAAGILSTIGMAVLYYELN